MIRRRQPDLPVGDAESMGVVIPFPGTETPSAVEWTTCEECGEELMVGDVCVWCEGEVD